MHSTRRLPLQFLCPAWSTKELVQLSQRRGYSGPYRPRRWTDDADLDLEAEGAAAQGEERAIEGAGKPGEKRNRKQPPPTLFDELFPEDVKIGPKKKRKPRELGKLPAFDWKAGHTSSRLDFVGSSKVTEEDRLARLRKDAAFQRPRDPAVNSGPAVLLISSVSKSLAESDFMRLSPKAEHIEGWSNGLIKVIQARDIRTLNPLSFYYLLFNSIASATIYRENLVRLHALSKTSSFIAKANMPLPTYIDIKDGEDVSTLLKSFTILPSTGRLFVRLLREPFTPFIRKMIEEGNHTAVKEQQGRGDALVMLTIGSGRFSEADIHEALNRSGRKRNLQWQLAGGECDVEKINGDEAASDESIDGLLEQEDTIRSTRARWRESRFVLAMKDRNEARRFVREWHRLPLPLGKHPPIVNVQTLW